MVETPKAKAKKLRGKVLLHMPLHLANEAKMPQFYRKIAVGLRGMGADVAVVHRDHDSMQDLPMGKDFHLVHNGAATGACVLNCAIAYLLPFFYADPKGIYHQSSVNDAVFDPADVPANLAAKRFAMLRKRYVEQRQSRYAQEGVKQVYPKGSLAVFLQDVSDPVERSRHMDARAMVHAVIAGAGDRMVIVKPHPRTRGPETEDLLAELKADFPQVIVTEGNLHDILVDCSACISISSSVAIESMLHRKPAILFGRSDLHHGATTITRPRDFAAGLADALLRDWPYEAYVYWFFDQHLRGGDAMFAPLLARMQAAGADFKALGISPPSPPIRQ